MSGYIPDGYTRRGFLRGIPRLYEDLRFTYRPILLAERSELNSKLALADPKQIEKLAAEAAARHLVSWDLAHDGSVLSITAATLLRLQPSLFDRLYSVLHGRAASDEDSTGWADEPLPDEAVQQKN